jgi:hypothetical protein
LRAPLSRDSGRLEADTTRYSSALLRSLQPNGRHPVAEQVAVYNRQYWFRLFTVLQKAFPLASRIVGYWEFNGIAAAYLEQFPPVQVELDAIADGFAAFVEKWLDTHELPEPRRLPFLQAVRIDSSWRAAFLAPAVVPFQPTTSDMARLPSCRLLRSPAFALVAQNFPLLDLRASVLDCAGEAPLALPSPSATPEYWALVRTPEGMAKAQLEPHEARLHQLVTSHPLAIALAQLENETPEPERADLPRKTREWLAKAVRVGAFVGMDPA